VVPYSSVTGEGIEELKRVLDERVGCIEVRDTEDQFARLAIDRCFDLKGIGTVITGTLLSGTIHEGDEIVILPPGHRTKARQIQEHNQKKESVGAGERVAINLPGIEKHMVERGFVIAKEGTLTPTERMLVRIEPARGVKAIKDMTRVKAYLGSGEFIGRLELVGKRKVPAGEPFVCYLVCEGKMVAMRKDRFILRFYSPMRLLGGGVVLDAFPEIRKRFSSDALQNAEKLAEASDEESLLLFLHNGHMPKGQLSMRMQLHPRVFESLSMKLLSDGRIAEIGDELITTGRLKELSEDILRSIDDFHSKMPLKKGIDKEQLRVSLHIQRHTLDALLAAIREIEVEKNFVRRAGFTPQHDPSMKKRRDQVLQSLKGALFSPEKITEDDVVRNLRDEGEIVRVKGNIYFHKDAIEKAKVLIRNGIAKKGALTAGEIKDILHTTRRYAIPLLEYLDSIKFTIRKGDVRELGKSSRE
jgi:selenocysteine-specific elongation factor